MSHLPKQFAAILLSMQDDLSTTLREREQSLCVVLLWTQDSITVAFYFVKTHQVFDFFFEDIIFWDLFYFSFVSCTMSMVLDKE